MNWRDIKNPSAGGAEQLTHEVAKRWAALGESVIQISSGFVGGKRLEIIDGVRVIRLGRWWSVHILAVFYYLFKLRRWTDTIVDEVHWFPFFARIYAPRKTVLLVCEVADKLFDVLFSPFAAKIGKLFEDFYLCVYRNGPTLAISPSTKKDLIRRGFNAENVTVLPMGLTVPARFRHFSKETRPTLIYLGRLNRQKGIEDAIEVLKLSIKEIKDLKMWIVGVGRVDYVLKLKQRIKKLGLRKSVVFYGFVSSGKKFELLARAHVLVVPSWHEGWGLVVPEAGMTGTPAVVYDVPGLRDVVNNTHNGYIVSKSPQQMANKVVEILSDGSLRQKMGKEARKISTEYSWDQTAVKALEVIKKI